MSRTATDLWTMLREELAQFKRTLVDRATVSTLPSGRVRLIRIGAVAAEDEEYARIAGVQLVPGDEIVTIKVGGKDVVLGKLQRSAPSGFTFEAPVALPAGSSIGGGAAPFDQTRVMQYLANAGLATLTAAGAPAPTTDGTLSSDDDSGGAWVRFATTATTGTNAGISSAFTLVWPAWEPTLIARLRLGTSISDVRIWVGLTSATFDGSANPAGHHAAFRFDSGSDLSWRCCVKDGATQDPVVSGVVVGTSQIVTLRIDLRPGHALFSIDGVQVADLTANLPAATQPLGVQVRVRNLGSATKFVRFGRAALLHR